MAPGPFAEQVDYPSLEQLEKARRDVFTSELQEPRARGVRNRWRENSGPPFLLESGQSHMENVPPREC